MVTFTAPPRGTINRAPPQNPISVIMQSILGVFIGILMILFLAPTIIWFAENQNSAKVFSFTNDVESTSGAVGFIRTMDVVKANVLVACYQNKVDGDCLYYNYKLEELQYTTKDYCGTLQDNQEIIEEKGQECYWDNNNEEVCEQCYLVNESNWEIILSEKIFQTFSIGDFRVDYPYSAKIVGAGEYNKQIDKTHKEEMEYINDNTLLLVAGNSNGKSISHGGNKRYLLVSTRDYQGTYDYLKFEDRKVAWGLRLITFIVLLIGYLLIFGPISAMSNLIRNIPLIGKWIDELVGGLIFSVSLFLALTHFIILWVLIMLIKNIITVTILIALGILIFYLYTYYKKKK